MFDDTKPTAMMLGRWQPFHKGHKELFKKALKKMTIADRIMTL